MSHTKLKEPHKNMPNLKNFWSVTALAVVIVGTGMLAYNMGASNQQALISSGKVPVKTVMPTSTGSTNNQGYSQLVQQYRTAIIQFLQTCQATPNNSSFKNGTSIMLDNRSSKAHVVSIAGMSYNLPAYGYQVVSLTSATLPGTLLVNCDGLVSVSTIHISQ